jgi:transglutaminase-like putative cysteine protease
MTMYRVSHRTTYEYSRPMSDGFSISALLPRTTEHQHVLSAGLTVEPAPDEYEEQLDRFGNRIVRFGVHRAHVTLDVLAMSQVEVEVAPRPTIGATLAEAVAATAGSRGAQARDVDPFRGPSAFVPELTEIAGVIEPLAAPDDPVVDVISRWCSAIFTDFTFDPTVTDVTTPLAEVLANRHGVCQHFAHVAIAGLRHLGLTARYVSGYLETVPPPGQPKLIGADASHAWCSVWLPGHGWADFDPTNDQFTPHRHVTVGWGRDYADVAPLRGVVIGPPGTQDLLVAVDVTSG